MSDTAPVLRFPSLRELSHARPFDAPFPFRERAALAKRLASEMHDRFCGKGIDRLLRELPSDVANGVWVLLGCWETHLVRILFGDLDHRLHLRSIEDIEALVDAVDDREAVMGCSGFSAPPLLHADETDGMLQDLGFLLRESPPTTQEAETLRRINGLIEGLREADECRRREEERKWDRFFRVAFLGDPLEANEPVAPAPTSRRPPERIYLLGPIVKATWRAMRRLPGEAPDQQPTSVDDFLHLVGNWIKQARKALPAPSAARVTGPTPAEIPDKADPGTDGPRLRVNLPCLELWLDGNRLDVQSEQALRWVAALATRVNQWVSSEDLVEIDPELIDVRTERLKALLPERVQRLIESKRARGSRLKLA
jgi:hypothetical protein